MTAADQSATKRALAAIKTLQDKLDAVEREKREPIAIVGMACRFPGGADTPEAFWQLLCSGRDATGDVPASRWDVDAHYDPNPDAPGKTYTRRGGFLPAVDQFDPHMFGISPREAASIDPQHRMVLELAWEALENANIPVDRLYNSSTGVYVGISNTEYSAHLLWSGDPMRINAYAGTGGSLGVAAGRLSYTLGLTGPSLIVDTACSSSLVTTHLACQALRNRECDVALSAGVNLIFGPETFINFSRARMLSPDGRCKTFDASADGYARGEGGGVIVLKRLSDARRDGDRVLAVIRGSAVNQDGPSGGLTVPNGPAQTRVIRQALEAGAVKPAQVGYVEAHGTGTALGDPIEIRALAGAYAEGREATRPLMVGSVKTNFGHLESAAGIAGLIKAVLVLQHGEVPPHLHFTQPSPHIPWSEVPITVPTALSPWHDSERFAGVSSFSFSGTNAHVVLSSAPPLAINEDSEDEDVEDAPAQEHAWRLIPMSARDDGALDALAASWRAHAGKLDAKDWPEVARTAAECRAQLTHRLAVAADSPSALAQRLAVGDLPRARAAAGGVGKVAFLFTGQGSQYHRMGQELYRDSAVFRAALDECNALLQPRLGKSLIDLLYGEGEGEALNVTSNTQPVLFSIQYALMRLWQSWGIRPDAMLGHSVGEYAAACIAGVFTLEEATALIAERGRLMQTLCAPGAMVSVPMSEQEVLNVIKLWAGEVAVATLNGPRNVVVSSNPLAVDALTEGLVAAGVDARQLRVSHGFHSPMMEPMLAPFASVAQSVKFRPASVRMYSTLTGAPVTSELSNADYWVRHVEAPVRFADGMQALLNDGYRVFIEIGPKPTLCALGREIAAALGNAVGEDIAAQCLWLPSLRAGKPGWATILESLGQLWVRGAEVDWQALNGTGPRQARLPNYPFQRRAYGIDWGIGQAAPARSPAGMHPLLGNRLESPALGRDVTVFAAELSPDTGGLLAHHKIFGAVVLPAAGHMEMALAAAAAFASGSGDPAEAASSLRIVAEDVAISSALVLPEEQSTSVQIVLTAHEGAQPEDAVLEFGIYSRGDVHTWHAHSSGRLKVQRRARHSDAVAETVDLAALRVHCGQTMSVDDYYERTHAVGIEHGERFRALKALWRGEGMVLAQLQLPQEVQGGTQAFLLHPVLLDAAFQMVGAPLLERAEPFLPVGMDVLERHARLPAELWCVVRLGEQTANLFAADLDMVDGEGRILAAVKGLRFQRVTRRALQVATGAARFAHMDCLYQLDWEPSVAYAPNAQWMPQPQALAAQLQPAMADAVAKVDWYADLFKGLDRLVACYAHSSLKALGLPWLPGQSISLEGLMQQLKIVPAHRALFKRLLAILAEQGMLQSSNDGWNIVAAPADNIELLLADLTARFPGAANELALVSRCGASLAQALDGRIPGLQLLFPDGDMSVVTRFYTESPGLKAMNDLLRATLAAALARLPEGSGVRILEIGAGTGSSTVHLLPHLPASRCHYVFTDISPVFTSKARERFANDYPFLDYKVLNIENDPMPQGFEEGGFDIIIAANVLHATENLGQTLEHTRKLLAPGGSLLLLEGTSPQPWLDLTFGLTDGWWRFSDTARRPDYPLLSTAAWDKTLRECGFAAMEAISPDRAAGRDMCRQAVMVANKPLAPQSGNWLVLADRGGVGKAFADLVRTAGAQCSVLDVAAPVSQESLAEVLAGNGELRGIVYARGLDAPAALDAATLASAQMNGCRNLLDLLTGLGKLGLPQPPRLLIATRGAIAGPPARGADMPSPLHLDQAPLWGMGRVVAAEYPELHCTQVDLDAAESDAQCSATVLWREAQQALGNGTDRTLIVRADGGRHTPRLQRMSAQDASQEALVVREDGMIVITGGLGDLGLLTARWLAEEKGARFLTLVGRKAPSAAAAEQIAALQAQGVRVEVAQSDVADVEQARAMIANATRIAPLAGVIHAAGVLDDGLLNTVSWERFAAVLQPKTLGAWNLHLACEGHALDFFVLYSSAGSVLGPTAQASYAAANAFLDTLAAYRRAQGLPAMAVNWGAWAEIGMVARGGPNKQLDTRGMGRIAPAQGMAILDYLFTNPATQAIAAAIDWERMLAQYGDQPLFARFASSAATAKKSDAGLRDRIAGLPPVQQKAIILDAIKSEVARILGLESPQAVEEEVGFFEIGMDSLTAVELRNALQTLVGRSLPTTLLFKYSTVQALAAHLFEELANSSDSQAEEAPPPEPAQAEPAAQASSAAQDVDSMTDDEIMAMIDAELGNK